MKKLLILLLALMCVMGLSACELETAKETPHTHTYSRAAITTVPTCMDNGVITFYCACGATYNSVFQATGHNYQAETTAPTCTEQGYTTYTCKVCGDTYISDYVDELGHTPAAAVEENRIEPTCTENGSYDLAVYCTVCGKELSRETYTIEPCLHTYVVENVNKVNDNVYTVDLKCLECDNVKTGVNAVRVQIVDSTCIDEGYGVFRYYYKNKDVPCEGELHLDFTPIINLHTLGYIDGEPVQFEAFNLSTQSPKYDKELLEPVIEQFIGEELKFNGGDASAHIATFECVHCHKLIVIYLGD